MKKTIFPIGRALPCLFLSKADSYAFTHKSQHERPKWLFQIIRSPTVLFGMVLFLIVLGTSVYSQVVPIKVDVGELLPKEFWKLEHDVYSKGVVRRENLERYKGNLFIIDVWASWCTNCLHSFPRLDSLAKKSNGYLKVILLNPAGSRDDVKKLNLVYNRYAEDHGILDFPSIINDSTLVNIFSLKALAQYLWIDRDGRVIAKTGADFLNQQNVDSINNSATKHDNIVAEKKRRKKNAKQ